MRTPNPTNGGEAVSVMRVADLRQSDPDLAGLMIRCATGAPEVLVVLLTPLPARAHPRVTFGDTGASRSLSATVAPPGVSVLLPAEAASLVGGPWLALEELKVEVANGDTAVRGVIPMQGLAGALATLAANCPAK